MKKLFLFAFFCILVLHSNNCLAQHFKAADLWMPIRTFYYPSNGWELDSMNQQYLKTTFIASIETLPDSNYQILLEGHTDDVGNRRLNRVLSGKRVRFVYDLLVKKGIPPHRITTSVFGAQKPEDRKIALSKSREAIRYANRRLLLIVLKRKSSHS